MLTNEEIRKAAEEYGTIRAATGEFFNEDLARGFRAGIEWINAKYKEAMESDMRGREDDTN
jgi:hypothetical protein